MKKIFINKILPVVLILVVAGLLISSYKLFLRFGASDVISNEYDRGAQEGKKHFIYKKLEGDQLARSGEHKVSAYEINSTAPMFSFKSREKDIIFVLAYRQFVSLQKEKPKKIEFSFKKVSSSPQALLNQYGVKNNPSTVIEFDKFSEKEGVVRVDGAIYKLESVDKNNVIWAAHETEVYQYKLKAIDRRLKEKVIKAEALKVKLSLKEYKEKYINSKLPEKITDKDINQYLDDFNINPTERNKQSARQTLLRKRKQRGFDYILEKYIMKLPIEISLIPPSFKPKQSKEWVAEWGSQENLLEVTLLSGTKNKTDIELINTLFGLTQELPGVSFLYRPVYHDSDRLQKMATQMQYCIYKNQDSALFWKFFKASLGPLETGAEESLYEKANGLGVDVTGLKSCMVNQEAQDITDYHEAYATYLGVSAGPVVLVGGEVLTGAVSPERLRLTVKRVLGVKSAGIW